VTEPIGLTCRLMPEGFVCEVVVGIDPAATHHTVRVSQAYLARLAPGHYDPQTLVGASFEFLLAREPRESILRDFELPAIERYFPGYEDTIKRKMVR
jgi:hypothetical protein